MDKVIMVAVGLATGVFSGMGLGGGSVLIIVLTLFLGVEQLTAQGINLLYFLPCAAAALIVHFRTRSIDKTCALWAAGAGMVAAVGGSLLAAVMDAGLLKKVFAALVLYIGVTELFCKKQEDVQK